MAAGPQPALETKVKSDNVTALKEYLLAEYGLLTDLLNRNEEIGDRRLQFLIGLVTAVFAGLGFLVASEKSAFSLGSHEFAEVAAGGLFFLVVVGCMTLERLNKRDRVSEEYKEGLKAIRKCFLQNADKVCPSLPQEALPEAWPYKLKAKERVGRTTVLVMVVNTLLGGTLAFDLTYLSAATFNIRILVVALTMVLVATLQWLRAKPARD